MKGLHRNPYVLGANDIPVPAQTTYMTVCATAQAPKTGFLRVYWHVSQVTAQVTSATPRVRVGWTVTAPEQTRDLSLVCDAWYGELELTGSSLSVSAGFEDTDTPGGEYRVAATIIDGGSGLSQNATFTRHCVIGPGAGLFVYVPGAIAAATPNRGAHRARSFTFFDAANTDVSIVGLDWAGTPIQNVETGVKPAPPLPVKIDEYPIHPSVKRLLITNRTLVGITDALLMFRFH